MKLFFWILISKLLVLTFIGMELMPDEAQYWTWSKELSYGYYSKPPGIAWQIAFGTFLFGDTEFGVRFGSWLLSFFLSYAIYGLTKAVGLDKEKQYWITLAFSYSPLGIFSGFFATTDCAYVLFWTLACIYAVRQGPLAYVQIGLLVALGALWKWPIYAIWIPIALFYYKQPARLLLGMLISLLGLIPSLIWNIQHDFVTFQHVQASVAHHTKGNPVEFLGAQVALVSPILFALIIISKKSLPFCRVTALFVVGVVLAASFFEKVQGNWAVAAYPTAFMLINSSRRWILAGILVSVALIAALLFLPLPYKMNPFKQSLGSKNLSKALLASGYNPNKDVLVSDRYQMTSLLSFYGPEKIRAYFLNIHGLRHNQFDLWPQMPPHKSAYFVETSGDADRFIEKLTPYFASVEQLPSQPIYGNDKEAIIIRATDYNGKIPSPPNKY